jgi:chitinase
MNGGGAEPVHDSAAPDSGDGSPDSGDGGMDTDDSDQAPAAERPLVIGYFMEWATYDRGYDVRDVRAEGLTHLLYAFIEPTAEGTCAVSDPYAALEKPFGEDPDSPVLGHFRQLQLLKQASPELNVVLSIGGWSMSDHFSDIARDGAGRRAFAASCVALMREYGFDGLDVDWEYPVEGGEAGNAERPEDRENHGKLLRALRDELDAAEAADGRAYVLGAAVAVDPGGAANLDGEALAETLDWIGVMAYDMRGPWSSATGLQAALRAPGDDPYGNDSADEGVQAYLDMGVPASKIAVGIPFYGRGWAGVSSRNDGLYQSWSSLPEGPWASGVFEYRYLVDDWIGRADRHWEPTAAQPWLYDADERVMISYDDPESIAAKTAYACELGLGGVMFWELSGDTSDHALLDAIDHGFAACPGR